MQLFQCARIACQRIGIFPSQPDEKYQLNFKTFLMLMPTFIYLLSSTAFLLLQANSIADFEDSFLMTFGTFATIINVLIIAYWKMTKVVKMMQLFEEIIGKSKKIRFFKEI